ncbi:hypothetical protein [Flavilitoribacter nigricans]|uniref:Uncharacterized protein n=1 Tax=Flavilitoribacter nigricans (strain ATCC 23147 / DSM 23189 / NBRC 102662 / NCIMB 1420 / SS-2) TaxID=1122177 RepID=A0A2D0N0A8_FLAN2|nr:hypothetical protein [Flavilitoribacter nigricans]PHN01143.1 hypothetical protein CRP01_38720 [Flavilitoribacter nigricans DSM 23189 = NBRC 102662]
MDTTKSNRFPLGLILVGLLITGIFIYMSIPKKWEDATKVGDDGAVTLSDDWAGTVERKQDQYANQELYALTAVIDSYFLCQHCPTGKFFLKTGEIYRYGTTGITQNKRGFNEKWLNRHKLNYVYLQMGDLATIKTREAALIGAYAVLPENLARPISSSPEARAYWYRLVLPPGNNSLE